MAGVAAQKLICETDRFLLVHLLPETFGNKLNLSGAHLGSNVVVNLNLPLKGSGDGRPVVLDGEAHELPAPALPGPSEGEADESR
jgi:hypothetical protein